MALDVKVGSFDFPNTAGNFSVTGVGFQPKLVLFFEARLDAFGTGPNLNTMFGAAASSTQQFAVQNESIDGLSTSQADRASRENQCIFIRRAEHAADFISMDADGFTIDVNTTESDNSTPKVAYIAIGGSDVTNVQVGNFAGPSSSGNSSVTGVGFQPDLVLFSSIGASPANVDSSLEAIFSLGAATDSLNQWLVAPTSYDGQSTTDTGRYQRTNKCVCQQLRGSVSWEADLVSMDADGFTLNYSASTSGDIIFYVALKGPQVSVFDWTETATSGTNVSQAVTGVGFQPLLLLNTGWGRPASTALQDESVYTLGAATGPSEEQCIAATDEHAVGTTNVNSSHQNSKIYESRSPSTFAVVSDAELTSFDSDGFTVNWLNTDGGSDQILALAIAPADSGADVTGSGSPQAQSATATGTGIREVTGSGTPQAQDATATATGEREITGSGTPSAQAATASGTGEREVTGSATVQSQDATATGSGGLGGEVSGSGSASAQDATATGSGSREIVISAAVQARDATASGTGEREITGSATVQSQSATASGTDIVEVIQNRLPPHLGQSRLYRYLKS